jgi:hypothetical protein
LLKAKKKERKKIVKKLQIKEENCKKLIGFAYQYGDCPSMPSLF